MALMSMIKGASDGGGDVTWSVFEVATFPPEALNITINTPSRPKTYAVLYNNYIYYRKFTSGTVSLERIAADGTTSSGPTLNSETFGSNSLTIDTTAWGGQTRTAIIIVYG